MKNYCDTWLIIRNYMSGKVLGLELLTNMLSTGKIEWFLKVKCLKSQLKYELNLLYVEKHP